MTTNDASSPLGRGVLPVLARNWWALVLRGLAAILFGVLAFAWPGITLFVLVLFFGAYMLVDGIFAIVAAVRAAGEEDRWWLLLVVLPAPAGLLSLVWLIGAYAVATGVLLLILGFRVRSEASKEATARPS
jgi:uncharacterized membrane protein HdeD (DUF308 family)